ncbi:hypothetical protein [uncultured Sphingomonas sp.]|uniref:hypothetical protein n=1 Tax=uncultured Sphingomonas sp. TaxID=158754 RepID=UPI002593B347|nr:hypothetical protein [uncultured Sphingomonas sp.]
MFDAPQLSPLIRVPADQVLVEAYSETHLACAFYTRDGTRYWQKVALADLPNDFLSIEDLERHGVLSIYVSAVEKLVAGGAVQPLRRAGEGLKQLLLGE